MRVHRLIRYSVAWVAVAVAVAGGLGFAALRLSLTGDGEFAVEGLSAAVTVASDRFGVPVITAGSRLDAFRALGYVTARDRLFQMDALRRRSAGRLAEIFGEAAVSADREQRVFGFEGVASEVARRLPAGQREALQAYADGVNSAIGSMGVAPFEFLLLGYRPDRWRVEDSLLIVLGMFETLSKSEGEERMLSVMERALPSEVYRFLTPETDRYTRAVLEEGGSPPTDDWHWFPCFALCVLSKGRRTLCGLRFCSRVPTRGRWPVSRPRTAGRSWRTTCTWGSRCRACGIGVSYGSEGLI